MSVFLVDPDHSAADPAFMKGVVTAHGVASLDAVSKNAPGEGMVSTDAPEALEEAAPMNGTPAGASKDATEAALSDAGARFSGQAMSPSEMARARGSAHTSEVAPFGNAAPLNDATSGQKREKANARSNETSAETDPENGVETYAAMDGGTGMEPDAPTAASTSPKSPELTLDQKTRAELASAEKNVASILHRESRESGVSPTAAGQSAARGKAAKEAAASESEISNEQMDAGAATGVETETEMVLDSAVNVVGREDQMRLAAASAAAVAAAARENELQIAAAAAKAAKREAAAEEGRKEMVAARARRAEEEAAAKQKAEDEFLER